LRYCSLTLTRAKARLIGRPQIKILSMHRDNRQQEPNLMDPEDREAFLYDPELLNAWFDQPIEEEDLL